MAKKILAAALALVMCASLAACGDKKEDKDSSSKASKTSDSSKADVQTTSDETVPDETTSDETTADEDKAGAPVNNDTTFQTAEVTMKLINNNIIYIVILIL